MHMKSIHNQKLEFLHYSFFCFLHTFCSTSYMYFSVMLWFDLVKVLKSKPFCNYGKISHFSFFILPNIFCCKLLTFTHFLGIFSKVLMILELIRYFKNITTLFKCLLLQVYSSNLNSMSLNALACIFLFHLVKIVLSNVI